MDKTEKSYPVVRVLLVIAVVGAIAFWYKHAHKGMITTATVQTAAAPQVATVSGPVGGEKLGYLADPEVIKILRDKYGLAVNGFKEGSIDMVQGPTTGDDFLWPSSQVALELYKERGGAMKRSDTVFSSPIVFYSWTPVVDALIKVKVVRQLGASYYVADAPKLIRMIDSGTQWKEIGLPDLYGRISIRSTDPAKSNSGMMFSGLLANIVTGDVVTDQTLPQCLPTVKTFFSRLGYMEGSSADLFDQFVTQGEGQNPMIVAYENQLTEYTLQHPDYRTQIQQQIRILYPQPTVWSDHPFIALTDNGARLLNALQSDPDLRRIAWEGHGFRTSLQNDPKTLQVSGIPATIQNVVPMPRPQVMATIIKAVSAD